MSKPLYEMLRPQKFEEILGQDHLLGEGGVIQEIVERGDPRSMILWGPPGTGKTTIARLYARAFDAHFVTFSAVLSGVGELRNIVQEAENSPFFGRPTILFVDEIHRFNKAQQDGFLPYLEKGTFILVGATTENPSFALNDALLSRVQVLPLYRLENFALEQMLCRYETLHAPLRLTKEARESVITLAQGDGRYLINIVDSIRHYTAAEQIDLPALHALVQRRAPLYDRQGDGHYNLISALHKSVRGSDPDAALYWLSRMLSGGEDPLFIVRRMIRMASEDIGLADPTALQQALAAKQAYEMLGSPEGELALAQCVVYLALAPKPTIGT
jgi:putative ATPase